MFKAIRTLASVSLQQYLLHREFWIRFILNGVLPILVPLLVWQALYKHTGLTEISGWNQNEMTMYYLVIFFLSSVSQTEFHYEFSSLIHQGNLNQVLLYPLSFVEWVFSKLLSRVLILGLSMFLALFFLFLAQPNLLSLVLNLYFMPGLVTVPLAISLVVMLTITISMSAFWLIRTEGVFAGIMLVLNFFGGLLLPIELLPKFLQYVSNYLPMKYAYYLPATSLIEPNSVSVSTTVFGQLVWIIVCLLVSIFLWKKGLKKFDAVGA